MTSTCLLPILEKKHKMVIGYAICARTVHNVSTENRAHTLNSLITISKTRRFTVRPKSQPPWAMHYAFVSGTQTALNFVLLNEDWYSIDLSSSLFPMQLFQPLDLFNSVTRLIHRNYHPSSSLISMNQIPNSGFGATPCLDLDL